MAEGSFVGGAGCVECGGEHVRDPGTAKLCPTCRDLRHPPILLNRGSKWSPLQLGFLSLVCDVMLIPTVLAITRGIGELREVGRREAAGLYREEHERVRTGAVWGITLGAVRPGVVVFAVIVGVMLSVMAPATEVYEPFWGDDELSEIFDAMGSDDIETRALAMTHFGQLAPNLSHADVERSVDRTDREFTEDPVVDESLRSTIIVDLVASGAELRLVPMSELYPRLDRRGREAVLELALRSGDRAGLHVWLELVRLMDDEPRTPPLEVERLVELSVYAGDYLPMLLGLPPGHPGRVAGDETAGRVCADTNEDELLPSAVRSSLLVGWARARAHVGLHAETGESCELGTECLEAASHARASLAVLGCAGGSSVGSVLRDAASHRAPLVAVGAVDAMLARGDRVSNRTIRRLSASVASRAYLYDALVRERQLQRMPARFKTRAMMDEARAFQESTPDFRPLGYGRG